MKLATEWWKLGILKLMVYQSIKKFIKSLFCFDPHESFFNLFVVRFFFFFGFSLSILSALIIIFNSDLTTDWSYVGFNSAVSIFKVPLGIIASLIPIIAVLAANHRSEQTREQIKIGLQQNIFTNYYKHLEEFIKHCDRLDLDHGYNVTNKYKLHHSIFYKVKNGDNEISPVYHKLTEIYCKNILELLRKLKVRKRECQSYVFRELNENIDSIKRLHFLEKSRKSGVKFIVIDFDGVKASFPQGRFDLYLKDIQDLCNTIATIYIFESDLENFDNLDTIRRIDIKMVPKDFLDKSELYIDSFDIDEAIDSPIDAMALAKELAAS